MWAHINILEAERARAAAAARVHQISSHSGLQAAEPLSSECGSIILPPPADGNAVSVTSQAGPSVWQRVLFQDHVSVLRLCDDHQII